MTEAKKHTSTSPRVRPSTAELLAETFGTKNAGAEMLINAWPPLWRATLAEIREAGIFDVGAEAMAVLDVCNGLHLVPELCGQHIVIELEDAERLNTTGDDGVIFDGVIDRLRAAPTYLRATLEWWAAAFWLSDRYNDDEFVEAHLALVIRE